MSELTESEIEDIRKLISNEIAKDPLSPAQKWGVAKVVSAILLGGFALLGVAGIFVVENAAKLGAANVTANDVANSLAKNTDFKTIVSEKVGAVPVGAVVAFNIGEGCPEGWKDYANARGRAIIGAGKGALLTPRAWGEKAGEEMVKLEGKQLPREIGTITNPNPIILLHSVSTEGTERRLTASTEQLVANEENKRLWATGAVISSGETDVRSTTLTFKKLPVENTLMFVGTGEDIPHNNMPPFIALHFCEKVAS